MKGTAPATDLLGYFPLQSLSLRDSPTHPPPDGVCPAYYLSPRHAVHCLFDQLGRLQWSWPCVGFGTCLLVHIWQTKLGRVASSSIPGLGNCERYDQCGNSYSRLNCHCWPCQLRHMYHHAWSQFSTLRLCTSISDHIRVTFQLRLVKRHGQPSKVLHALLKGWRFMSCDNRMDQVIINFQVVHFVNIPICVGYYFSCH